MTVGSTPVGSVQVLDFEDLRLLIPHVRLVSASCSSIQCFASDFLQILPHGGHPCRAAMQFPLSGLLGTLTRWRVRPAGRTMKKAPKFGADGFDDSVNTEAINAPGITTR
jgi:hypothetical protein